MECDICLIEWDTVFHIPRILSCGHTICEACLISMLNKCKNKKEEMFCAICKKFHKHITSENEIRNLIKNINLLRITEKLENKRALMGQSFKSSRDPNNYSFYKVNNNPSPIVIEKNLLFGTNELVCKVHGLQLHSYSGGSNLYQCDLCIKEINNKSNPIGETFRKIDTAEIKLCLIKNEIERLEEFFISYLEEFDSSNLSKLDELFQYLNKLILYNYNTAKTVVYQCKKEQEIQIELKLNELKKIINEVRDLENKITIISSNGREEKYLVKCNDELNEILSKLNQFMNYEAELNLFHMNIGIKDNVKDKLFEFIQDAYFVDVDNVKINGQVPVVKHILMKDKYWQCICGEIENLITDNKCVNCELYRKIESYHNILSDPISCAEEEINQLNSRRRQEIQDFQLIHNDKNYKNLFAIDIEWFLNWKCFATNDTTEKYLSNSNKRISSNKNIGILPPGPITNLNLFEKGSKEFNLKTLKVGLKKNDDYLLINEKMWKFFYTNYNSYLEIKLDNQNDIYSFNVVFKEGKFSYKNIMKKNSFEFNKRNNDINFIRDYNKYEKEGEENLVNEQILKNENYQQIISISEELNLADEIPNENPLYSEENFKNKNELSNTNIKEAKKELTYEHNENCKKVEKINTEIKLTESQIERKKIIKNLTKKHSIKQFISNFSFEDEDPYYNTGI